MTTLVQTRDALHLPRLAWWQWCRYASWLLFGSVLLLATQIPVSRLIWALTLHLLLDFGVQSTPTALGKAGRNWRVLFWHGLLVGGYSGLLVGGLVGWAVNVAGHIWIDGQRKFGLPDWRGPVLDQLLHLALLGLLWGVL